jgi:hypothetical protein
MAKRTYDDKAKLGMMEREGELRTFYIHIMPWRGGLRAHPLRPLRQCVAGALLHLAPDRGRLSNTMRSR